MMLICCDSSGGHKETWTRHHVNTGWRCIFSELHPPLAAPTLPSGNVQRILDMSIRRRQWTNCSTVFMWMIVWWQLQRRRKQRPSVMSSCLCVPKGDSVWPSGTVTDLKCSRPSQSLAELKVWSSWIWTGSLWPLKECWVWSGASSQTTLNSKLYGKTDHSTAEASFLL